MSLEQNKIIESTSFENHITIKITTIDQESIPLELRKRRQWVLWQLVETKDRFKKIPYMKNGLPADPSNPETWSNFDEIFSVYKQSDKYGIGYMFLESDPYLGVDCDDCIDENGVIDPEILKIINLSNSYTEYSPSGRGVHIIIRGTKPGPDCGSKKIHFEMYEKGRFFTLTGNRVPGTPVEINEAPEAIKVVYDKILAAKKKENSGSASSNITMCQMSDNDILQKCQKGTDKAKFETLYNGEWEKLGYGSQSEADLALCSVFATYTQDRNQIDRLFSGSKLYREKWNRADYKQDTIDAAIEFINANPFRKYFIINKFVIKLLADELMSEYRFATMRDNREIFIYENGVYRTNGRDRILQLAQQKLQNYSTPARGNDVVKFIETATLVNRDLFNTSKTIINLKNGLYDLTEDKFKAHTPELLSTIQLPVSYDPFAKCPRIEKFLSEIVSEQDKQVLLEWFGLSMIPDTRMQKAVMLIGEGNNGKGVFLKLLTQFIGAENCSGESLQNLETEKFSVAELYGKLLNIHADLPSTKMSENSVFKQLVGGDRIRGERKFQAPFTFYNITRLIFSANEVPAVSKKEYAFFRRWILLTFPHKFEGRSDNKNLLEELITDEELSGLLNKALLALKELLYNGRFSYELSVEQVEDLYTTKSDSVAAFVKECIIISTDYLEKPILYEA